MDGYQHAEDLRESAVGAINALIHDLCHAAGVTASDIVDLVVCGNTAMQHLLLGLPVRQLGRAPFIAALGHCFDAKAREVGIRISPGAYIHVAPSIGGFVGGDHVTALLATESRWGEMPTCLVLDIGTNTEISVIHLGKILSTSSPSGPALEGGHISCGMRAAEGAIERVHLNDSGRIQVRTIGGTEAVGLCGSGVLDTVASLHRGGILNDQGRISAHHPDVIEVSGKRVVRLAPNVLLTQDDIRAVQLAKAAIRAAIDMLLTTAGISAEDIGSCIIAGAFGSYIDVRSAIAIGMLPNISDDRYHQVGNAAGLGARMMLVSGQARNRASTIAEDCKYVELSTRKEFQRIFLGNIGFPHIEQTTNKGTHCDE